MFERVLIEAFASGEGRLSVNDPPAIEGAGPDRDDDTLFECALEPGTECLVSTDSDLLEPGAYVGIPILTLTC